MTIIEIAIGVALAPVVFAMGVMILRGLMEAVIALRYAWDDWIRDAVIVLAMMAVMSWGLLSIGHTFG
ncbi:MAG TPA: hypothetical protein VNH39_10550 [Steroidobacteraceae bacterium]|nr:hypothetical protein [Steroidobacteraceae bacterium]